MIFVRHGYAKVVPINQRLCLMLQNLAGTLYGHLVGGFRINEVMPKQSSGQSA